MFGQWSDPKRARLISLYLSRVSFLHQTLLISLRQVIWSQKWSVNLFVFMEGFRSYIRHSRSHCGWWSNPRGDINNILCLRLLLKQNAGSDLLPRWITKAQCVLGTIMLKIQKHTLATGCDLHNIQIRWLSIWFSYNSYVWYYYLQQVTWPQNGINSSCLEMITLLHHIILM